MSMKFVAPLALATLTASSASTFAASQMKTGEVKSADATKHELTLVTGDTFELGTNIKLGKIKAGDMVAVTYAMKDGKMVASKIHPTK